MDIDTEDFYPGDEESTTKLRDFFIKYFTVLRPLHYENHKAICAVRHGVCFIGKYFDIVNDVIDLGDDVLGIDVYPPKIEDLDKLHARCDKRIRQIREICIKEGLFGHDN